MAKVNVEERISFEKILQGLPDKKKMALEGKDEPRTLKIMYQTDEEDEDSTQAEVVFEDPADIDLKPRLLVSLQSVLALKSLCEREFGRVEVLADMLHKCRCAYFKELLWLREQLLLASRPEYAFIREAIDAYEVYWYDPPQYVNEELREFMLDTIRHTHRKLIEENYRLKMQLEGKSLSDYEDPLVSLRKVMAKLGGVKQVVRTLDRSSSSREFGSNEMKEDFNAAVLDIAQSLGWCSRAEIPEPVEAPPLPPEPKVSDDELNGLKEQAREVESLRRRISELQRELEHARHAQEAAEAALAAEVERANAEKARADAERDRAEKAEQDYLTAKAMTRQQANNKTYELLREAADRAADRVLACVARLSRLRSFAGASPSPPASPSSAAHPGLEQASVALEDLVSAHQEGRANSPGRQAVHKLASATDELQEKILRLEEQLREARLAEKRAKEEAAEALRKAEEAAANAKGSDPEPPKERPERNHNGQVEALKRKVKEQEEEIDILKKEIAKLKAMLENSNAGHEGQDNELRSKNSEIRELRKQLAELQDQFDALVAKLSRSQDKIRELKEEVRKWKAMCGVEVESEEEDESDDDLPNFLLSYAKRNRFINKPRFMMLSEDAVLSRMKREFMWGQKYSHTMATNPNISSAFKFLKVKMRQGTTVPAQRPVRSREGSPLAPEGFWYFHPIGQPPGSAGSQERNVQTPTSPTRINLPPSAADMAAGTGIPVAAAPAPASASAPAPTPAGGTAGAGAGAASSSSFSFLRGATSTTSGGGLGTTTADGGFPSKAAALASALSPKAARPQDRGGGGGGGEWGDPTLSSQRQHGPRPASLASAAAAAQSAAAAVAAMRQRRALLGGGMVVTAAEAMSSHVADMNKWGSGFRAPPGPTAPIQIQGQTLLHLGTNGGLAVGPARGRSARSTKSNATNATNATTATNHSSATDANGNGNGNGNSGSGDHSASGQTNNLSTAAGSGSGSHWSYTCLGLGAAEAPPLSDGLGLEAAAAGIEGVESAAISRVTSPLGAATSTSRSRGVAGATAPATATAALALPSSPTALGTRMAGEVQPDLSSFTIHMNSPSKGRPIPKPLTTTAPGSREGSSSPEREDMSFEFASGGGVVGADALPRRKSDSDMPGASTFQHGKPCPATVQGALTDSTALTPAAASSVGFASPLNGTRALRATWGGGSAKGSTHGGGFAHTLGANGNNNIGSEASTSFASGFLDTSHYSTQSSVARETSTKMFTPLLVHAPVGVSVLSGSLRKSQGNGGFAKLAAATTGSMQEVHSPLAGAAARCLSPSPSPHPSPPAHLSHHPSSSSSFAAAAAASSSSSSPSLGASLGAGLGAGLGDPRSLQSSSAGMSAATAARRKPGGPGLSGSSAAFSSTDSGWGRARSAAALPLTNGGKSAGANAARSKFSQGLAADATVAISADMLPALPQRGFKKQPPPSWLQACSQ